MSELSNYPCGVTNDTIDRWFGRDEDPYVGPVEEPSMEPPMLQEEEDQMIELWFDQMVVQYGLALLFGEA